MSTFTINSKGQAVAPSTHKMNKDAFKKQDYTSVYWLGGGGAMINMNGTVIMIDPLLKGFDMDMLVDYCMDTSDVPHVDGVLISHVDNDHYSRPTLKELHNKIAEIHTNPYVASLMKEECDIDDAICNTWHDEFDIHDVHITVTPADHNWQSMFEKYNYRKWPKEEYCGFYLKNKEHTIWYIGDSRLMAEQLDYPEPDLILFDFADNAVHIGLENAYKFANNYPNSKLLLIHWGCVDAPEASAFNGNPQNILDHVVNNKRVLILAPGEEYILGK